MRKLYVLALLLAGTIGAKAALNLQLHYDLGKDRKYLTSTIENFTPDKYGSTFFFVDMDYNVNDVKGVSTAYMEIARGLKFWEAPFEAHIEYNGGMGQYFTPNGNGAFTINDAWLVGGTYNWHSSDFSKIVSVSAMYKNIRDIDDKSFQITGVWDLTYFNGKFTFRGFADFWKEEKQWSATESSKFIFLTEPQFWFNFNKQVAIGSEVEIGYNFGALEGFNAFPTIAAKYIF